MSQGQEPNQEQELADPDDYHRKQRLKEIHQARQHVLDLLQDPAPSKNDLSLENRLAYAISMYVIEIEPLAQDFDVDTSLPEPWPFDTIFQYADAMGRVPGKNKYTPPPQSLTVYRKANQILAEIKPLISDTDPHGKT